jgi:hypothetical protein
MIQLGYFLLGLRNGKGIWTRPYENGFIDVY